mgnify:CR=1 FL=1
MRGKRRVLQLPERGQARAGAVGADDEIVDQQPPAGLQRGEGLGEEVVMHLGGDAGEEIGHQDDVLCARPGLLGGVGVDIGDAVREAGLCDIVPADRRDIGKGFAG